MKTLLASFLAIVALGWAVELQSPGHLLASSLPWAVYQEALLLSGLLSIALMSLAMVLATRPAWLERPLGGMDRIYRLHKWSGILAIAFAAIHWLVEMADDILKELYGRAGRTKVDDLSAFPEPVRDLGEGLAEWGIYLLFALLALTLWKRFSYRLWRPLHRAMPVFYLTLAFHAVVLAPAGYWRQPLGLLLAVLFTAGSMAAVQSLTSRIGRGRRVGGRIVALRNPAPDVTEVTCRLDEQWRGHRPGQFALVTFDAGEGAHPFTIASADRGDRTVVFAIKALGDYTSTLSRRLKEGAPVQVEGPYGRFDLQRASARARQIWIAGGIGVTPFLAWLECLQGERAAKVTADLHYCVRDLANDPFVERLQRLSDALPEVHLYLHDRQSGPLSADTLAAQSDNRPLEIWFCGPKGLAKTLSERLRNVFPGKVRFHQEAFELR